MLEEDIYEMRKLMERVKKLIEDNDSNDIIILGITEDNTIEYINSKYTEIPKLKKEGKYKKIIVLTGKIL